MAEQGEQGKLTPLTAKQHAFVAAYLGEARLNATEAASLAGYKGNRATLRVIGAENLAKPNIQEAITAWRNEVKTSAIADVEYRITNLDGLLQDFYRVKIERAQEWAELEQRLAERPETRKVYDDQFGTPGTTIPAGAGTGLILRQIKMIGSGQSARTVEEFGLDGTLVDRILKVQEEAAKELGQRIDKSETKHDVTEGFLDALRTFGRASVSS